MTLEISTILPYTCPQQWASKLQQARADGVRYFMRHAPAAAWGIAVFAGPAGSSSINNSGFEREDWDEGTCDAIDDGLLERLRDEFGLAVEAVDVPRVNQLRLIG